MVCCHLSLRQLPRRRARCPWQSGHRRGRLEPPAIGHCAGWYLDAKENEGWPVDRLQPLLAGLQELLPWLKQWHNDLDPVHSERMGDYYAGFVADEARALGFTADDLRECKPAITTIKRGRKKKA